MTTPASQVVAKTAFAVIVLIAFLNAIAVNEPPK